MGIKNINELYFDESPDALLIIDSNGKIISINKKAAHLFKSTKNKLEEILFNDLLDKSEVNSFTSKLSAITKKKSTFEGNCHLNNNLGIAKIRVNYISNDTFLCLVQKLSTKNINSSGNLELFIEQSPNSVGMFDLEMNYIACSDSWVKDWNVLEKGLSKKKIIGLNHYELFSDIKDEWKKIHKRGLKGETIKNERDYFLNEKGEEVWLSWQVRPWYNNDENIGGIFIFSEILTEQIKTQFSLSKSEHFNRSLVDNSPIAIIIQDIKGNILFTNQTSIKWIGAKTKEELIGLSTFQFIPQEFHERVKGRIENIFKTNKPSEPIEQEFLRLDGKRRIGRSVLMPFEFDEKRAVLTVITDITDIKEASLKIIENEEKLRQVIDLVPHMIFAKNIKGEIVLANKAFAEHYNTSIDFIIKNKNVPKSQQPKGKLLAKFLADDEEVLRSQLPKVTHIDVNENEGKNKYIQTTKVPYKGSDPSDIALLGISVDITERIEYEQAIESSRLQYKTLVNTNPDLIFINSLDGTFLDFHGDEKNLILSVDALMGKNVGTLFSRKLGSKFIEAFKKADKSGEIQIVDYSLEKDNSILHFEARIVKFGKDKLLTIVRDITKQKEAENALKMSEEKLNLFFSQSLDGFFIMEAKKPVKWDSSVNKKSQIKKVFNELHITKINNAMLKQYGLKESEMLGYTYKDFFHFDINRGYESITEMLDNKYQNLITSEKKKNGQKFWIEGNYICLMNEKNEITATFGIQRDITQRIKDDKDLKNLASDLVKTNNELQQFAYITSHDLRAPVVNLKSLLEFYNQKLIHEENWEVFKKIELSIDRLSTSLNDLVEVVAVKKKSVEKSYKIKWDRECQEILSSIEALVKETEATITTDFSKAPIIYYPSTHIRSILQNLLTNALKYKSKKRAPVINVSTKQSGEFICLEVADNGLGIDLEKHGDRLFGLYQKFHELPNSKGLGLYLVKTQVELLGGYIEIESEVDKGTKFKIHLLSQK